MKISNSIIKVISALFICSLALCSGCKAKQKNTSTEKMSICLQEKMEAFKKTVCAKGASIKQYQFQNAIVYAFIPGNCGADLSSDIVNTSCETIGFLGGIMGNSKINGEEFSNANWLKTIWTIDAEK